MRILKGFLLSISILVVSGLATFAIVKTPEIIHHNKVERASVSSSFDVDTFRGWVLSYNAIKRANNTLYNNAPKDAKTKASLVAIGYPDTWLPELIQNYGIAVQKDYSGRYIYEKQKKNLMSFYNDENTNLTTALNSFKTTGKEVSANDANVIEALNGYIVLVGKLQSSTNQITIDNSKETSIGSVINKDISEKDMATPIAQGQVANEYLEKNITQWKGTYAATIKDSEFKDNNPDKTKEVNLILGIK